MTDDTLDPVEFPRSASHGAQPEQTSRLRYAATELFGDATEIIIEFQGVEYRLRITSNGKLILTK